eukprot:maker-scaffold_15-snap-gene-7.38-mRNA-1 protein AED:0.01 eAED:0.01 QI:99/1/1/1/1/1/2/333/310
MENNEKIEAFVYRKLRDHLETNGTVQNIKLMNLAGFCRNCLAKWYFMGAAELGVSLTYEDALKKVYGMDYKEYKKQYQTKASPEDLQNYKNLTSHHSQHLPLDKIKEMMIENLQNNARVVPSDVCCEPMDGISSIQGSTTGKVHKSMDLTLAVLTVSDRASKGEYLDLSGPLIFDTLPKSHKLCTERFYSICADEKLLIKEKLDFLCDQLKNSTDKGFKLLFTTGGTGLARRDVTPEATKEFIDIEVKGISEQLRRETAKFEPLAYLSRGISGLKDHILIINLPGRPQAVLQYINVLSPMLKDIESMLKK